MTFTQAAGEPLRLVAFGDDMHARYETLDGYTVVYDVELVCTAPRSVPRDSTRTRRLR